MKHLKPLQRVRALGLLPNHIQHTLHQLCALGIKPLRPIIARAALPEHEGIRLEQLSVRPGARRVHRAWLEADEDGAGDGATRLSAFVVVDADALELEVRVALVLTGRVEPVFVGDDFPELGADLVAAGVARRGGELDGRTRFGEHRKDCLWRLTIVRRAR